MDRPKQRFIASDQEAFVIFGFDNLRLSGVYAGFPMSLAKAEEKNTTIRWSARSIDPQPGI
jgi:hypothetical protein